MTATAGPDLSGFLMGHRGFRAEFGRIAAAAQAVRDDAHAALLDDQIDLVMHLLHHHHTAEDDHVWPTLVARAPEAAPALARLESQHEDMDPLFTAVTDKSRPIAERVDDLYRLHDMLNAHLDEEEAEAVPLIRIHFTAKEWDKDGKKIMKQLDRKRLPMIVGWLASASTPEEQAEALRGVPLPARPVLKYVVLPAYAKRFAKLYGGVAAVPVPA